MPRFIDTRGHDTLAVAICDRCREKYPHDELVEEPITHLRVCTQCLDERDPYTLPARKPDRIGLSFVRPDSHLKPQFSALIGRLAVIEGADSGDIVFLPITDYQGQLAAVEGADALVAAGSVSGAASLYTGTLAATEGADAFAAAGTMVAASTLAAVEGADRMAAAGVVGSRTGTMAATEGADKASAAGTVNIAVATYQIDQIWETDRFAEPSPVLEAVSGVNLGTQFTVNKTGYINGVIVPRAGSSAGTGGTVALYRTDNGSNALVASKAFTMSGYGQRLISFDAAVPVVAGQAYRAVFWVKPETSDGRVHYYTKSGEFSGGALTSRQGALTATQGYYAYLSALSFPTNATSSSYRVDLSWSDTPLTNILAGYPTAATTGVPAGTQLTSVTTTPPPGTAFSGTDAIVVTTPGVVIEGYAINGRAIVIKANDVRVSKCSLGEGNLLAAVQILDNITGVIVEDCTMNGGGTGTPCGINGPVRIARRNNIYGYENSITLGQGAELNEVYDNYCHDHLNNPKDATSSPSHYDAVEIYTDRPNLIVRHNTLVTDNPENVSSNLTIANRWGDVGPATIQDNYFKLCTNIHVYVNNEYNIPGDSGFLSGVQVLNNKFGWSQNIPITVRSAPDTVLQGNVTVG